MLSDNKYTIKPALTEKFSGIIWKIEIDNLRPLIAVETRNRETRTSSISVLNFETGETAFKELSVIDSWSWNLDRLHNGVTYLHSYLSKEAPVHKGIIALNLEGNINWQAHNKTLHDISDKGLIAYDPRMQPRWLELLEEGSGKLIQSNINDYNPIARDIQVPNFISDKKVISLNLPGNIFGEVAFYHFNNKDVISYHTLNGDTYTQHLLVTEGDKIFLNENLEIGILKLNPEAFFISRSNLFCVRGEKREIVSYLV